jgi:hypothetical protein
MDIQEFAKELIELEKEAGIRQTGMKIMEGFLKRRAARQAARKVTRQAAGQILRPSKATATMLRRQRGLARAKARAAARKAPIKVKVTGRTRGRRIVSGAVQPPKASKLTPEKLKGLRQRQAALQTRLRQKGAISGKKKLRSIRQGGVVGQRPAPAVPSQAAPETLALTPGAKKGLIGAGLVGAGGLGGYAASRLGRRRKPSRVQGAY